MFIRLYPILAALNPKDLTDYDNINNAQSSSMFASNQGYDHMKDDSNNDDL